MSRVTERADRASTSASGVGPSPRPDEVYARLSRRQAEHASPTVRFPRQSSGNEFPVRRASRFGVYSAVTRVTHMTERIPADEMTDGVSAGAAGGADDAELLARMARADADELRARQAWGEFYSRHAGYLRAVGMRAYAQMLGGPDGVGDLLSETFALAYRRAGTFRTDGITDPDRLRRRARAWLGWIARRVVQDALRGRGGVRETHLRAEHWQQVARDESRQPVESADVRRVREALLHLAPREQWVLRVTFQYYQPDRDHQRLPNDVCADLTRTLRTTPENLRQIRKRALAKLARRLQATSDPTDRTTP